MNADFVIEVTELNFEYEVLSYSRNKPVLVDFWAEWCQPCKVLGPSLEKAIFDEGSDIRLAKVNIDQNPNLAIQYGVRSIPIVKAFVQGSIVSEFVGVIPTDKIRAFIKNLVPPSPFDLAANKATSLLGSSDWIEAESIFRDVLKNKPDSSLSLLGLVKSLLAQGKSTEALDILSEFPASKEYSKAMSMLSLAEFMEKFKNNTLPDTTEIEAAFKNSIRLTSKGNMESALDGLLVVLQKNKQYLDDKAHQIYLGILEVMGEDNPETASYRRELANTLF
jgi:putative thioredoxin